MDTVRTQSIPEVKGSLKQWLTKLAENPYAAAEDPYACGNPPLCWAVEIDDNLLPDALHNLTGERILFCYNADNPESLWIANYYARYRSVPSDNLLGLTGITVDPTAGTGDPCWPGRTTEVVIDETEFDIRIQTPILTKLIEMDVDPYSVYPAIWCIITGFDLPHAYYPGDDPYAPPIGITSRLSRVYHSVDYKHANPLYNKKDTFRFYNGSDANIALITSVIDGPTSCHARRIIDRSTEVSRQNELTGKIYIDPYGKRDTENELEYESDILDFVTNELSNLGLTSFTTSVAQYFLQDPTIPELDGDSFYWGWYRPRFSSQLVEATSNKRCFLYNADDDSASALNERVDTNAGNRWCNIAIDTEPPYASTAGAVSAPGSDAHLRPRPFFEALHQGACLGECFLYASPYVDWKIILVGDPLMTARFPSAIPDEQDPTHTTLHNDELVDRAKRRIEQSLAYGYRQWRIADQIVQLVVNTTELDEEIRLLEPSALYRRYLDIARQREGFELVVDSFLRYISRTTLRSFQYWLTSNNKQITPLLSQVIERLPHDSSIPASLIYSSGYWEYIFTFTYYGEDRQNVHFQMQIASDDTFGTVIFDLVSSTSQSGWTYESELRTFVQLQSAGLPSNFSGRRIKFSATSSEHLSTGDLVYVRWRVTDASGVPASSWTSDTEGMIVIA